MMFRESAASVDELQRPVGGILHGEGPRMHGSLAKRPVVSTVTVASSPSAGTLPESVRTHQVSTSGRLPESVGSK